jgi:hypothetical protein
MLRATARVRGGRILSTCTSEDGCGFAAFGEKPAEGSIVEFLRSRDGLELNKAFVRISDVKARRAIVDLVRSLANDDTVG